MMRMMRTTIALDDDLVDKLKDIAQRRRVSFRQVVNDAVRRGLSAQQSRRPRGQKYTVSGFSSPFRPGVDPLRLNQLADELEAVRSVVKLQTQ